MDAGPFGGGARPQRPSVAYFMFLSLVFFMLSNNGPPPSLDGGTSSAARNAVSRFRAAFAARGHRRDGLALALGQNATFEDVKLPSDVRWHRNASSYATLGEGETPESSAFEYDLAGSPALEFAPALVAQQAAELIERPAQVDEQLFAANLTGYIRGDWRATDAGLPPTFNKTISTPVLDLRNETTNGTLASNATEAVNVTTVAVNRTALRGSFDFERAGQLAFNLREELRSAVAIDDGDAEDHKAPKALSNPSEDWERLGPVSYLHGDLSITSEDETELALDVEGVHFLTRGTFFAHVTPPSVASQVFRVPQLALLDSLDALRNASATAAAHAILKEVDRRLEADRQEALRSGVPPSYLVSPAPSSGTMPAQGESTTTQCEWAMYGALAPLPETYTRALYDEYLAALFHPTGASLPKLDPSKAGYLLYSENCGLVMRGEGVVLPSPLLWERATTYAVTMAIVQGIICVLLAKQMEWASSPSASASVAHLTIGFQIAMDSYFFIIHFTVGIVTDNRASLPILVPAFFAAISALLFGVRYAALIRGAYVPETETPATATATREDGTVDLDAAVAVLREADWRARVRSRLPSKTTSSLLAIAVMAITIIVVWGWTALFVVVLYSYWLPQIFVNARRGSTRRALRGDYIIGTTACRLVLPLYIWAYRDNVLFVQPSRWVYTLVLYSSAQAAVLLLQNTHLGPRFFLPQRMLDWLGITFEPKWDYHPMQRPEDLETGKTSADCCICLEPTVPAQRYSYMVPPCGHVAHTHCLESWLTIKSVCPVCRRAMPPL